MSRQLDLTGQRFCRLVALEFVGSNRHRQATWKCRCDCGNEVIVVSGDLRSGTTKSCGCLHKEQAGQRAKQINLKHGQSHTREGRAPTYWSWRGVIGRCTYPKHIAYKYYGGNHVTVCERWTGEHGFENFLSDMGERPEGTSLGRFGDVGNYEPSNCKWMTVDEQAAEKRKKNLIRRSMRTARKAA